MSVHRDLTGVQIHVPYAWSYANETAREAATGFTASDVGKLSRQLDDNTLWMLTDDSPVTWTAAGGSGGSGTSIPVQATAPSNPSDGDLWIDSDATPSGGGSASLIEAEVVVETATTQVVIDNLDGNADGGYRLDFSIVNANGSAATDFYLHVNEDTTVTNYYCEYNLVYGSNNYVGNANTSAFASAPISGKCQGQTVIMCDNSRFNYISDLTSHTTTDTRIFSIYGNKTADVSNITSITITAATSSGIAAGSTFRLYRRK